MGLNSLVFGRCCGEWGRRIEAQHTHFLTQSNPNHHRGRIRGVPGLPATPPPPGAPGGQAASRAGHDPGAAGGEGGPRRRVRQTGGALDHDPGSDSIVPSNVICSSPVFPLTADFRALCCGLLSAGQLMSSHQRFEKLALANNFKF